MMSSNKQTILVTGANGQVGRSLQNLEGAFADYKFHFLGREHLPLQDFKLVDEVIEALKPHLIINAAAYTAVDKAEVETESADLINGFAVGNLAAAAKRVESKFIHISTDYVYDGNNGVPYVETDKVNPLNAYGKSKLLGEQLALSENPDSVIVRTSWVYSPFGSNFVKTMLRLMSSRTSISVVNDQTGSPTYACDLAEALLNICTAQNSWVPGIYHYSNMGNITWFRFAQAIQQIKGFECEVIPISTAEFPTPAKRPSYTVMNCQKIVDAFGITIQPWESRLRDCLSLLD